jgi:hypothetical protein
MKPMSALQTALLLVLTSGRLATAAPVKVPYGKIDSNVWAAESGGTWVGAGGVAGHYRAVVYKRCTTEHCYDTLYVEWITVTSGGTQLVTSKQIVEVGDLTVVLKTAFVLSGTGTRLEVANEMVSGDEQWTRCFQLGSPGQYVVFDGPCKKAG